MFDNVLKAGNKATHKQHAYFIKGSGTSEGGTVMGAWHLCKTQAKAGGRGEGQAKSNRQAKAYKINYLNVTGESSEFDAVQPHRVREIERGQARLGQHFGLWSKAATSCTLPLPPPLQPPQRWY